ncbi:MAG: sulfatase-like hydrolase/transferase, partial [Acidobacteriota bacterium]|nr:sulfatase-like hydrolase/transferase [Acidobacteriota bacterium]
MHDSFRFSGRCVYAAVLAIILGLIVPAACRKHGPADLQTINIIRALTPQGIIASPLREAVALNERIYPVQSAPLEAGGWGEDPLGLKRRVNLGLSDVSILFAPPRSEFLYELPAGPGGRLDFGVGIVRDGHSIAAGSDAAGSETNVRFLVILESQGRKKVLFEQTLLLPRVQESRSVNYAFHSIPVPARKMKATLRMITIGHKSAFAFWQSPAFFIPQPEAINVVLISIDTLRPDHLGAYGYDRPVSPAIDALAAESALFKNVYSTAPWTLPAHMSIMTGMNCVRHRVFYEYDRLAADIPTLALKMQERGYATHAITGGGFVMSVFGFRKGFDEYSMNEPDLADPKLAEHG